jgi:hypothetical protein
VRLAGRSGSDRRRAALGAPRARSRGGPRRRRPGPLFPAEEVEHEGAPAPVGERAHFPDGVAPWPGEGADERRLPGPLEGLAEKDDRALLPQAFWADPEAEVADRLGLLEEPARARRSP